MSELPDGWQVLSIGALATPRLGGNYKNGRTASGRPLIKMGNIARVDIDLARVAYIPDSEAVDEAHRLRYGDVLFNTRNTLDLVGKVSIWRDDLPLAYYNSNILRLEFLPDQCGDSRYFGYALNTKRAIDEIRAIATGTTSVAAVYTRDLLKLEIPVPPPAEQQAIAAALDAADAVTSSLERMLTKKQAIKQGVAQALYTGRVRLPGFSASWDVVRFGRTVIQVKEKALPADSDPTSTLVELEHIESGGGRLVASATAANAVSHKAVFQPGDVLFGRLRSYLRKYWLADRPGLCSTEIWVFRPTHLVISAFLRYLVESEGFIAAASGGYGTHMPRADWNVVRGLEVALPPLDEQAAIADVLADADAEIAALSRRVTKAKAVKEGMAQQLLTGRVRLPEQELVA